MDVVCHQTLLDFHSEDTFWCEIHYDDCALNPSTSCVHQVALTVARRVYIYGFPELVKAMQANDTDGEGGLWDCLFDEMEHLDEDSTNSMSDWVYNRLWVRATAETSRVDQNLLKLMLEGRLSEMNAPSTHLVYNLFMTIGSLMHAAIHIHEGNPDTAFTILMKRMQTETICQRRLASDLLSKFFERKKVPSFGWYAMRRVWFPAWKVSNYLWKVSGESSCAAGGDARMRHMRFV
jgi:hypothetical protein